MRDALVSSRSFDKTIRSRFTFPSIDKNFFKKLGSFRSYYLKRTSPDWLADVVPEVPRGPIPMSNFLNQSLAM